jgi:tight adherence protein C
VNLELITIGIGLSVFIGLFCAGYAIFSRALNIRARVDQSSAKERRRSWSVLIEQAVQAFKPVGEIIPRSPEEMSRQERRITQAGIRRRDSAVLFHGIQAVTVLLFALAFLSSGSFRYHPFLYIVLSLFLGSLLPDIVLTRMISRRKERIQLGLPDALDLTVVCVEAGLGLDQTLMRIGQEIQVPHPDLSDELRLTNLEMNMGRSRADSLRNLGRRTGVDDLKALCAILIQTDRFGTSVGQALRTYSESLRTKRRQRAEEKAAKLAVKMIPPLILFVFPSMFVVIVGPAVIGIIRDLLPAMRSR